MEIDPYLQFRLFLAAFGAGVMAGALWELLTVSRILLGAYRAPDRLRALYEKRLPLLSRSVRFDADKSLRRAWRAVLVGVGDLFFCLSFCALVILVLYLFNNGKFRILVPVLALGGFALFRFVSTRLFAGAVAYFAFGVAAVRLYLLALFQLPFKGLFRLFMWAVFNPVSALLKKITDRRATRITQRLCRAQLAWASKEFERRKDEAANGKKQTARQADASPMDRSHADSCDIRGGSSDRRRAIDGVESRATASCRGAKKKRRA